jgi:hypothetical protein
MICRLSPEEIRCSAPPYSIVDACQWLGFHRPLDVRWRHMGQRRGILGRWSWRALFGTDKPKPRTCTCGRLLPALRRYTFVLVPAKAVDYLLCQCKRCRTVFWEEG